MYCCQYSTHVVYGNYAIILLPFVHLRVVELQNSIADTDLGYVIMYMCRPFLVLTLSMHAHTVCGTPESRFLFIVPTYSICDRVWDN